VIVVDTNVIAYLFLGGEKTAKARAAYLKDPVWAAPILWRSEFRNVLTMYLRRGDLEMGDALALIREGESLLEGEEYQVESGRVLGLVCSSRCSAYDCEFVALAEELGVSLVTGDKRLAAEFPDLVVALDDFVPD
jgi:predicted nucleic acid-binding protein